MRLLLALLSLCVAAYAVKIRFDDHRVYRVVPSSLEQLQSLVELRKDYDGFNFWTEPRGINIPVDIMVSPHKLSYLLEFLASRNIHHEIFVENVQTLIDNERPKNFTKAFGWEDYYPIVDINTWMSDQSAVNPNIVFTFSIGQSYEGREIQGMYISYKPGNPAIFIESGAHAREWIAAATVTWIVNQLLYSQDPAIRNIAENFDWHIVPVLNVDGYEYTFTTDRMWRKTRKPNPGSSCVGTDPNRNFDYHWMDTGASSNPCDETFGGSAPFSEPETLAVANHVRSLNPLVYFCFHSYSQLLMIPYGLDYEQADNYDELMAIGQKSIDALFNVHHTRYDVGPIYSIIYPASGGSMDWVKKTVGSRFTFEWELRDLGQNGFILPADQIIPTGEETLASVLSILQDVQAAL